VNGLVDGCMDLGTPGGGRGRAVPRHRERDIGRHHGRRAGGHPITSPVPPEPGDQHVLITLPPGPVKVTDPPLSQSDSPGVAATRAESFGPVQVIWTLSCSPGVVGMLIEPFIRASMGASRTVTRLIPWMSSGNRAPAALTEKFPSPGFAGCNAARWVELVVATSPPTTRTAVVDAASPASRRRRASPTRRRAPATRVSTSG
jgi:hypothetical protein